MTPGKRPARNPHFETAWRRGAIGPAGSTDRLYGWVRVLPNGWVEFVDGNLSPHGEPVVSVYSPASLVLVTYAGAWEDDE